MKRPAAARYTKKQILEAIQHWEKQLEIGNYRGAGAHLKCSPQHFSRAVRALNEAVVRQCRVNESQDQADGIKQKVVDAGDELMQQIKTADDVKDFVEKNDNDVKRNVEEGSALAKAWELLKKIVSAGVAGLAWIGEHWKAVLVVSIAVFLACGGLGMIANWLFRKAVNSAADALEAGWNGLRRVGSDAKDAAVGMKNAVVELVKDPQQYADQVGKINAASDAATQALGRPVNMWTGAGLGGGLREDEEKEPAADTSNDLDELVSIAQKLSPETAKLAAAVKDMQSIEVNESSKTALFSLLGVLMLAVGCTKECVKKIETPLEQAAKIVNGTSEIEDIRQQYQILNNAIDQIGDLSSGIAGDVVSKWATGKASKDDAGLTLAKLARTKRGLQAKKAQITQKLFDEVMKD